MVIENEVNNVSADDLVPKGTRASADIVDKNNPVYTHDQHYRG